MLTVVIFFTGLKESKQFYYGNRITARFKAIFEVANPAKIESTESVIFLWNLRHPDQPNPDYPN